jgi:hypothetical protein
MMSKRFWLALLVVSCIVIGESTGHFGMSVAQQPAVENDQRQTISGSKFEFEVIESIDADYLGDTPGHHGRNGGLGNRRPGLSLGDPVYRGTEQVGILTQINWDRTRGSLDLEFDPAPLVRVNVGDVVWVSLDGPPSAKAGSADKSPDKSPPGR